MSMDLEEGTHPAAAGGPPEGSSVSDADDRRAAEIEDRSRQRQTVHFQRVKDEARALFGMVDGAPGVRSWADVQKLLEKAGDEVGNGRFLMRYLGAERYLDAGTVAVLLTLRQNLIADLAKPSAANIMMIDAAVIAYYNILRVQGWIGNLSLVFERDAFGQAPLDEVHGPTLGNRLREDLERLQEVLLPLQERCNRMLIRCLERLPRGS